MGARGHVRRTVRQSALIRRTGTPPFYSGQRRRAQNPHRRQIENAFRHRSVHGDESKRRRLCGRGPIIRFRRGCVECRAQSLSSPSRAARSAPDAGGLAKPTLDIAPALVLLTSKRLSAAFHTTAPEPDNGASTAEATPFRFVTVDRSMPESVFDLPSMRILSAPSLTAVKRWSSCSPDESALPYSAPDAATAQRTAPPLCIQAHRPRNPARRPENRYRCADVLPDQSPVTRRESAARRNCAWAPLRASSRVRPGRSR